MALGLMSCAIAQSQSTLGRRAAIYTRFSTSKQRSTADQIRVCREYAERHGFFVSDALIFSDEAKPGRTHNRPAFHAMLAALARNEIDIVILLTTSRFARTGYQSMMVIDEKIVGKGKRCIFVDRNIDTADTKNWKLLLYLMSIADEMAATSNNGSIKAAQTSRAMAGEVSGELPFGYVGVDIPGRLNRRGTTAQKIGVCPVASEWVRKIFHWYAIDRLTCIQIGERLRVENAPHHPKALYWKPRAIRSLLSNRRYIGHWDYGVTESEYISSSGGTRKKKLANPQREIFHEHLRIVDDKLFLETQARHATMPGQGGRKPRDGSTARDPLSCTMECPGHPGEWVWLLDRRFQCRRCFQERERRALTSMVRSEVARGAIFREIARQILQRRELIEVIVKEAHRSAQQMSRPDQSIVDKIARRVADLTKKINSLLDNLGDTDEDRAESNAKLKDQRSQRAKLNAELEAARARLSEPQSVPTLAMFRERVKHLAEGLQKPLDPDLKSEWPQQKVLIHSLIDLPIKLTQMGENKKWKGWLRATFTLHLSRLVPDQTIPGLEPVVCEVDLLPAPPALFTPEKVIKLLNKGLPLKKIAKRLKASRELVRATVIQHYQQTGLQEADAYRRQRLPRGVGGGEGKHALLEGKIMEQFHAGRLYGQIATDLKIDIHRVSDVVRAWHKKRGLDVLDGRNRRKTLKHKNRPEDERKSD